MTQPIVSFDPVAEEDDDDAPQALKAPVVDAKGGDRYNPEVEYDVLVLEGLDPAALKTRLNELGASGWQLVATTPAFIFRRIKAPDTKPKARVGFGR